MLHEHYPTHKLFEDILLAILEMDPVLAKIDRYLEHEKLYRLIKKDLSKQFCRVYLIGLPSHQTLAHPL